MRKYVKLGFVSACLLVGTLALGCDSGSSPEAVQDTEGSDQQASDTQRWDLGTGEIPSRQDMYLDTGETDQVYVDMAQDLGVDLQEADGPVLDILPDGCCDVDSDCDQGSVCHVTEEGGLCYPMLEAEQCFATTDCPVNHFCWGQEVCSCDDGCVLTPGICTPMAQSCCDFDWDCEPGFECAPTGSKGVCEPMPPFAGKCWTYKDCDMNQECLGASACPCDADCDSVDQYGTCTDVTPCGCLFDDECGEGQVCAIAPNSGGVCLPAPAFGECWDDSDCFDMSQTCEEEILCPCDALCDVPNTPGTCAPLPSGCCYSDADCSLTQVCRGTSPGSKMPGSCKDDLSQLIGCPYPEGCCWDDSDCADGKACIGGSVCGCIQLCYVCGACMEDQTGYCE